MPGPRPPEEGRLIQLVYYGYVIGSAIARAVPEPLAYRLADALGTLQAKLSRKKRRVVARNLARVMGQPEDSPTVRKLVVEAYRSYARYWLETFRLVREDRDFFLERFRCVGEENLDGVLARGKGAVVVVGHLGNWDAAGAWVGASGRRLVTVVEVLKPRRMFEFFAEHRARLGMTIHPARPGITATLVREVEAGAVLAIVGDRDFRGTGPTVEFFGEAVTLPAGPASIALRAGVPLLFGGVRSLELPDGRRGWEAAIEEPIELPGPDVPDPVNELTQEIARRLERYIARHPEQWHMFQPVWPADRVRA